MDGEFNGETNLSKSGAAETAANGGAEPAANGGAAGLAAGEAAELAAGEAGEPAVTAVTVASGAVEPAETGAAELAANEAGEYFEGDAKKMPFTARLAGVFLSPVKLMRDIGRHPSIGPMLLVAMALSLISLPMMGRISEISLDEMNVIIIERYGYEYANTIAQAQDMAASTTGDGAVQAIAGATTLIGTLAAIPIACAVQAAVLLLLTKIAKGSANFRQYMSMFAHVSLIGAVGAQISNFAMYSMGTTLNVTSLAAVLMPGGNLSMPAYNILSAIGVFGIWQCALLGVGVREINGFSKAKAATLAIIVFALGVAFTTGAASVSILMMDVSVGALGLG
jgi:hypothetical protein